MAMIDLERFNRKVDSPSTHTNPFSYSASTRHGTMYLFKPREVPDTIVRPYQYNFDAPFMYDLASVVDSGYKQLANPLYGGNLCDAMRMNGFSTVNKAIAPSSVGERFSGKYYGDLWTCMIVLDNLPFQGRMNPVDLMNRFLYFGFCLDEPIVNNFGNIAFNDRCALVITHVTSLDTRELYGRNGRFLQTTPKTDVDVIHPVNVLQSSPNRQFLLRPQDLVRASSFMDDGGIETCIPETNYLGTMDSAPEVHTVLNNPKEQISNIIRGLTKTIAQERGVEDHPFSVGASIEIDDDLSRNIKLQANMSLDHIADRFIGIPVNQPILLADVLSMFPILREKTQIIEVPWQLQEQSMDLSAPNPINIWTSLLMNAVPSVLASYGISDATFRYDSVNTSANSIMDRTPIYEVYELYTYFAEDTPDTIRTKWNQALAYLEANIFPIIIEQAGNFSAMIKYSASKECAVQLNLIDMYNIINDGVAINNSLYSGLQSPIVGSANVRDANARELHGIVDLVNNSLTTFGSYNSGGMY